MFQGMEYVYAVYQEKSFSEAAAKLFISQPSLSANVKRIEKRIGYPIFDRTTKPLSLTECGRHYIRAVENILSAQEEFRTFVNDWGDLKTGQLSLGGSNFFSSWVLPPLIGAFSRKYPLVKTLLLEKNTAMLSQDLQSGRVDFVMDNTDLDLSVFDRMPVQEEHLLLAVPKALAVNRGLERFQLSAADIKDGSFRSNDRPAVSIRWFSEEPFLFMSPDNDTGKRAAAIFRESQVQPRVVLELDQQMTTYNVACSGMGIAFVGDMLICRVPSNPDIVYYKLEGENSRRMIYLYWKRGRYINLAMVEFLKGVFGDGVLERKNSQLELP